MEPKTKDDDLVLHRLIESEALGAQIQEVTQRVVISSFWVTLSAVLLGFGEQAVWGLFTTNQLIMMITYIEISMSPELQYHISICQ